MRRPADNTALLRTVAEKAKAISARRAEAAAAQRAATSAPRAQTDPRGVLDRASAWAPSADSRSASFFVEDASGASEDDYSEGSDGATVVDLAYIVERHPPPGVVRGYLRAQALCVEEALDEAI